jgi:hypothetical protein
LKSHHANALAHGKRFGKEVKWVDNPGNKPVEKSGTTAKKNSSKK